MAKHRVPEHELMVRYFPPRPGTRINIVTVPRTGYHLGTDTDDAMRGFAEVIVGLIGLIVGVIILIVKAISWIVRMIRAKRRRT